MHTSIPASQGRTKRVHMVMTPDEWATAVKLAGKRGLAVSGKPAPPSASPLVSVHRDPNTQGGSSNGRKTLGRRPNKNGWFHGTS